MHRLKYQLTFYCTYLESSSALQTASCAASICVSSMKPSSTFFYVSLVFSFGRGGLTRWISIVLWLMCTKEFWIRDYHLNTDSKRATRLLTGSLLKLDEIGRISNSQVQVAINMFKSLTTDFSFQYWMRRVINLETKQMRSKICIVYSILCTAVSFHCRYNCRLYKSPFYTVGCVLTSTLPFGQRSHVLFTTLGNVGIRNNMEIFESLGFLLLH